MRTFLLALSSLLVVGCGKPPYQPITRTYFIAADEVPWDYAPSGRDMITGVPIGDPSDPLAPGPATYLAPSPSAIGRRNVKALYREYTDETFTTLKPQSDRWAHLGTLGPAIRAVVGDTIVVVFKNRTANLPPPYDALSVHPHGVFYGPDSEGAPYLDYVPEGADDGVRPGETVTYRWTVPERAGPGPNDGSSVLWMYHSHVHEVEDTYAGLIGPMIITGARSARQNAHDDPSPEDVDRELATMFMVLDENQSPYLPFNVQQAGVTIPSPDDDFVESNKKHSINGYVFGNAPLSSMTGYLGERIRWYVFDMGTEVDLHTPHWHGNVVTVSGMRTDVATLLPGTMVVADMVADNAGVWLFHCHVGDHIRAGMITRYQICVAPGDPACRTGAYPLQ